MYKSNLLGLTHLALRARLAISSIDPHQSILNMDTSKLFRKSQTRQGQQGYLNMHQLNMQQLGYTFIRWFDMIRCSVVGTRRFTPFTSPGTWKYIRLVKKIGIGCPLCMLQIVKQCCWAMKDCTDSAVVHGVEDMTYILEWLHRAVIHSCMG